MLVLTADLDQCMGYANCVLAADDYFDLDEDGGVVKLLHAVVREGDEARVAEAMKSCPVQALTVQQQ